MSTRSDDAPEEIRPRNKMNANDEYTYVYELPNITIATLEVCDRKRRSDHASQVMEDLDKQKQELLNQKKEIDDVLRHNDGKYVEANEVYLNKSLYD